MLKTPEGPSPRALMLDAMEVKRLAALIQTPAEFEQILAGVQDPFMQSQVRALLKPLLTFPLPESHGVSEPDRGPTE